MKKVQQLNKPKLVQIQTNYDRNLANFKAMLDAWNNQDVEAALNLMADDFMETEQVMASRTETKRNGKLK